MGDSGGDYKGNYWEDQYRDRTGQSTQSPLSSLLASTRADMPNSNLSPVLTHTDSTGKAKMVDVSNKVATVRLAKAAATVYLGQQAYELVQRNQSTKGDVLAVARIAGITGAKATSNLIPLCHNIPLSLVSIEFVLEDSQHSITVESEAKTVGVTGVEMEALTAVTVAALTVYDMCKAVSHDIVIADIKLLHKSGGKSDYNL